MNSFAFKNLSLKNLLLAAAHCCCAQLFGHSALPAFAQSSTPPAYSIYSLAEQARITDSLLKIRLERLLPEHMRQEGG